MRKFLYGTNPASDSRWNPAAEVRDLAGPLVFGGEAGLRDGVVAAIEDAVDGGGERGGAGLPGRR